MTVWGYLVLIFEHSRRGARAWGTRSSGLSRRLTVGGREGLRGRPRTRPGSSRPRVSSTSGARPAPSRSRLRGARGGRAAWADPGSDCVRNLRDGAPASTDNRPLAGRGRHAPRALRPAAAGSQPEKGAERRQLSGRAHWLSRGACALRCMGFPPSGT